MLDIKRQTLQANFTFITERAFQDLRLNSTASRSGEKTHNRYSCLAGSNEHTEDGVITFCDSTEMGDKEHTDEPLEVGDVVVGLFVIYRLALFEHRVLFNNGITVDSDEAEHLKSESSDHDERQELKGGSATSAGDDPVLMTIAGGGDQETNEASPPRKRQRRGKGRAKKLGRRRKSTRSCEEVTITATNVQNVPDEVGENDIENVTPTASPRLDRKAAWRQSPKGRASSAASSRKYEMSPLGRSTRRRYKTSEEGIGTNRSYESSQERKKLKKRNESTTKSAETRRRYRSAEGRLIRAEYALSEGGKCAKKRAMQKYGNTEHGRESMKRALRNFGNTEHGRKSLTRARKKYELKEAALKRRLRYKQRKAFNQRVRKAKKHLIAKAAETEPHRMKNDNQSDEETFNSKPDARNSCTNKEAMATIRSHKVRQIQD